MNSSSWSISDHYFEEFERDFPKIHSTHWGIIRSFKFELYLTHFRLIACKAREHLVVVLHFNLFSFKLSQVSLLHTIASVKVRSDRCCTGIWAPFQRRTKKVRLYLFFFNKLLSKSISSNWVPIILSIDLGHHTIVHYSSVSFITSQVRLLSPIPLTFYT